MKTPFIRARMRARKGIVVVLLLLGMALNPLVEASAGTPPIVTAISPTSGPTSGGTTVTVTGSGFTGATNVMFGTQPAANFVIASDTSLIAVTPTGSAGTAQVTVTTPSGTSATTAQANFTFVAPLTISPSTLPTSQIGMAYSQSLSASGGTAPYTFAELNGSLPPGMSFSNGIFSGTPTSVGTYILTIQVTDAIGDTVNQSYTLTVNTTVPGAPTIGTATPGDSQATVTFNAPASNGGTPITAYTVTSSPGGITSMCGNSPCTVIGLTNGTAYTFTVTAANSVGTGAASSASNSVTPAALQTITFNNPGTRNFGTSSTLTASASSGLSVTFTSATTAVCTITDAGALTTVSTGTCTINANQAGDAAYFAAPQVSQSFDINAVAPGAPVIGVANAGNTQATISFTPPNSNGGSAITSYTATSAPGGLTGSCATSPCTVTGLTNGTAYTFTVTATNSVATGSPSAASNSVTPKATGNITNFVANPAAPVFSPHGTFTVSATGDGSSSPVVFTIAASSSAICSISGSTVTTLSAGTCTVTANQAGDASHQPASQVTLAVVISNPPAPVASNTSASTAYNTAASINLGTSISGIDITSVTVSRSPAHGTTLINGETIIYTPSSTFYGGTDTFTYTATNPSGTSTAATVTVTVAPPAAPTVTTKAVSTPYATATSINVSGAITGTDVTSVNVATQPSHGTASVSGETITYTPSSAFYGGTDTFTYTASNPGGTSSAATVTVTVTSLATPTAAALSVSTTSGMPLLIEATAGASSSQPLTGVRVVSQPTHGAADASGEQITYSPATGFTGTDSFTYEVSNQFGSSQPATITVTVTAAGNTAGHSITLTTAPGSAVSANLAQAASGSVVSSALIGLPPANAGSVVLTQPTALTFTPASNFHGLAQITVALTNAAGSSTTVDVLVLVSSQPDPSKNPDVLGIVNAQTMEAQRFAQDELSNIQNRLESLHDGGGDALFSNTLSIRLDGKPLQGGAGAGSIPGPDGVTNPRSVAGPGSENIVRPGMGAGESVGDASSSTDSSPNAGTSHASGNAPGGPAGLGIWIGGTADFGAFDAYRQAAGFDSNTIAINAGVDQRIGQDGIIGLSVGYNHDNSDVANDGTRSVAYGYSTAVYGSFLPMAHTYIDAILGGGGLSFDSQRYDSDTATYLFGHRNGDQWFSSLTAGYEYQTGNWLLSPYARLAWSLSSLNSFSESGAITSALNYGNQTVRTSQTVLGVRATGQMQMSYGLLMPHLRLEIGHDFQGTSDTTLSYAFIPSAGSWNVLTNPYTANGTSVQAGMGIDLQLPKELLFTTEYDYLMQPHAHDQMIRIAVKKKF
jgi:uncharacterized protein YhjY with autotransporter beta-barrel domain